MLLDAQVRQIRVNVENVLNSAVNAQLSLERAEDFRVIPLGPSIEEIIRAGRPSLFIYKVYEELPSIILARHSCGVIT